MSERPVPIVAKRRWTAQVRTATESRGLALVFAGTRTRILAVRVRSGEEEFQGVPERSVLRLRWPPKTLAQGAIVELEIEFTGESPLIARAIWIAERSGRKPDGILPDWLTIPTEVQPELQYLWEAEVLKRSVHVQVLDEPQTAMLLRTAASTSASLHDERRRANEIDARVRAFFADLDERTDLGAVLPELADSIDLVSGILFQRIEIRSAYGIAGEVPIFDPEPEEHLDDLEAISSIFVELHGQHLVLDDGTDLMSWAFEQFCIDSAAVFHHDPLIHEQMASMGAPNGSEFFKFAELAFTCVENGVDAVFWEPHLLALVRAAHSFAEHADKTAAGSATMGVGNALSFAQGRWLPFTRRGQTREDYDLLLAGTTSARESREALEDRFGSLIAQLFFETSIGPNPVPARPLVHTATIVRPTGTPSVP